MAGSHKARVVVLKKTKLGETDLILTMLDEQGKQIRGVAKGARKPGNRRFGARLEPYSVADVVLYPGRSLENITDVRCVETNAACRESLEASSACAMVAELLEKATADGELEPVAVQCALAAYKAIGAGPSDAAPLVGCAALLKLAAMMGVRPILHECAACGSALGEDATFDLYAGGMLCSSCSSAEPTHSPELIGWLDALMGSTFAQIVQMQGAPTRQLLQLCDAWLKEHLGLRLKSIVFGLQM